MLVVVADMDDASQVRLLPVFTVFWIFLTFITSYSLAVWDDHVYPLLPYISETGTLPPESCVFGQMLNIGALLVGGVVYCRYRQAARLTGARGLGRKCQVLNLACLVTGGGMACGASLVANFQCLNMLFMHMVGAVLAFDVGIGYMVLQTVLSGILNGGDRTGRRINIARAVLCVLSIIFLVTTAVFGARSMSVLDGGIKEAMHYNPNYERYADRLISTFSEWSLALCIGLYLFTFTHDFKYLQYNLGFVDSRCERKCRPLHELSP